MRSPNLDRPRSAGYYLFYRLLFCIVLTAVIGGMVYAANSLEYTWRWNRVPQFFWATGEQETRADADGTITGIVQGKDDILMVLTPTDGGATEQIHLPAGSRLLVDPGQDVYHGDVVARHTYSKPGILLEGLLITVEVSALAIIVGIVLGLGAGLCRISRNPALRWGAITYIEIIRGSPLLVQIFLWYFVAGYLIDGLLSKLEVWLHGLAGSPSLAWLGSLGIHLGDISLSPVPPLWYGVLALAIFAGAYVAEIVRAGIQSVSRGQMEAARSLGMTHAQAMRKIILPQAFRRILPPLAGQFISLIKDSSLLGVMAVRELTKATREAVTSSLQSLELWFTCAVLYLVLTFALSLCVQYLERRAVRR